MGWLAVIEITSWVWLAAVTARRRRPDRPRSGVPRAAVPAPGAGGYRLHLGTVGADLAQAYGAAQGFQVEALAVLVDDAERAFAASGGEPYEDPAGRALSVLANVPAAIAFLRALLARLRGEAAVAAGYNRQALARLGEDEWLMRSFVRWNQAVADWLAGRLGPAERGLAEVLAERQAAGQGFLTMRVCYDLGQVQRAQGRLDAALATYRQALATAGADGSQPPYLGMAHVGLAQVLYEQGELGAALDHATRGATLGRQLAFTLPLAIGLAVVARTEQAQGDPTGALAAMGEAGQVELSPQVIPLLNPVPSQRARLLLTQGDVTAAAQWAKAAGLGPDDEPDYPQEPAYLVLIRVLLAQDRPGPALALLEHLRQAAVTQDRIESVIEIQALQALALAASGDEPAAVTAVAEALNLACPRGYVRVFADEGAPMRALLGRLIAAQRAEHLPARRVPPSWLAQIVQAFDAEPAVAGRGQRAAPAVPGLVEQLTGRELEVLGMLAAGTPNPVIAEELFVSLFTVKKHVSHILGKLGAANRTEAVARARELGLIT